MIRMRSTFLENKTTLTSNLKLQTHPCSPPPIEAVAFASVVPSNTHALHVTDGNR